MTKITLCPHVDNLASETVADAHHFVSAVTKLGDTQDVIAQEDIFASNGMKLIAKGARINSRMADQLAHHKLVRPLQSFLSTKPVVGGNHFANDVEHLLAQFPLLARTAFRSGDQMAIAHTLVGIDFPPLLAFKLTVMREQRPALYQKSLTVALLCLCIGIRSGARGTDLDSYAVAGLCHDLGELYIDPVLLAPEHVINAEERRFIYAHPITGYLTLKEFHQLDPTIARAVWQHHERMDGSGYPYGLSGNAISPLGRSLAVADTIGSVMQNRSHAALLTLLRLNMDKFDPEAIDVMLDVLGAVGNQGAPIVVNPSWFDLHLLVELLNCWSGYREALQQSPHLDFLVLRMDHLRMVLTQIGVNPQGFAQLTELAEQDPTVAAELQELVDEIHWQIADMEREIARHLLEIGDQLNTRDSQLVHNWLAELPRFVGSA
ncbi:MAG: HD domain-containing phosphohydrolase [Burkholderiaceae bacterium]